MSISKTSPIRVVMGFGSMSDANLVVLANAVLKALTGNASFPNPTVSLTTFGNDITAYSNAVTAALDGGKNAKAAREKAKKVVVKDLRQLANYVESNCNDEMAIFTTSGFTARAKLNQRVSRLEVWQSWLKGAWAVVTAWCYLAWRAATK